jgi:hypothetical protein
MPEVQLLKGCWIRSCVYLTTANRAKMAVECNVVTAGFISSLARTKFLSLPYHCCPRSIPVGNLRQTTLRIRNRGLLRQIF